jgi:alkanesulfonate monooxygenase SsuD/methylene tetrahydromethanopterin reductase-like flavin-dependent oxidoreductase (luciferase family)
MLKRDPAEVGPRVCIGSAEQCAELLSRYVRAGCQEIYFWPVGDQRRQIERIAGEIMPAVEIA